MKVKITVHEPHFTLQLIAWFNKMYKSWVDYAELHSKSITPKPDLCSVIDSVQNTILSIEHKKLAKLFYGYTESGKIKLYFKALKLIKKQLETIRLQAKLN